MYYIQDIEKSIKTEPSTEEENCIKETYEYFLQQTSENMLKKILKKKLGDDIVDALTYIDVLKALRDQVLNCTFISIAAADKDQANKIFAILNAKGKRLAYIDLIKNKIFEELREGVNGTFAEESWNEIKSILNAETETVGLATFFRHYWISKYRKCNTGALYDNFNKEISKNVNSYREFLKDLQSNAKNYMKIVNPKREDYDNRKEYYWLVQSLNSMNKTFNVVQTRIALLALFDVKERNLISTDQLKKAILAMENFHLAYTGICSIRSNNLEAVYSRFAISLRKCTSKSEISNIIRDRLILPLDKLYPSYEIFVEKFKGLSFTKKDVPSNVKAKYIIYKLNCYFGNKEIYEDDGSIEHILSETTGEHALNIGNLILLEGRINGEAGDCSYIEKIPFYQKSQYLWIEKFIKKNKDWDEGLIDDRANDLAAIYYKEILGRELPSKVMVKIDNIT